MLRPGPAARPADWGFVACGIWQSKAAGWRRYCEGLLLAIRHEHASRDHEVHHPTPAPTAQPNKPQSDHFFNLPPFHPVKGGTIQRHVHTLDAITQSTFFLSLIAAWPCLRPQRDLTGRVGTQGIGK